jgi:hypothetical protein
VAKRERDVGGFGRNAPPLLCIYRGREEGKKRKNGRVGPTHLACLRHGRGRRFAMRATSAPPLLPEPSGFFLLH